MPSSNMQPKTDQNQPWNVVSSSSAYERSIEHSLQFDGVTIEKRTGPHGKSILDDICTHLNQCGSKPPLKKRTTTAQEQLSLL